MKLQLIICHKKELLSSLSSIKLVLISSKCYQCKLVCTDTINEWCKILAIKTRGGVEDIRLEAKAKAKDTKKSEAKDSLSEDRPSRGHGQECSRPRTGMLEAKAKDQGHSRKCSPKKKLKKTLSGDLQFIGVPRMFDWGRSKPQITCNDVIKIFPNRKFLWDKDIVEWKI